MRTAAWLGLIGALLIGCEDGKACPPDAGCPEGASCRCDDAGRVLIQKQDLNADGQLDAVRYKRTAAGSVEIEHTDYADDGSVEREVRYLYDSEGRRTERKGWQKRCDGSRFAWECTFEAPCPPPFDACSPCVNRHLLDKGKGLEPCGATAKRAERESGDGD